MKVKYFFVKGILLFFLSFFYGIISCVVRQKKESLNDYFTYLYYLEFFQVSTLIKNSFTQTVKMRQHLNLLQSQHSSFK